MTNERMYCGNCGHGKVTLRAIYDRNREQLSELRVRCCNCKDVTIFCLTQPAIMPVWGKRSKGIFCAGWGSDHKPPKREKGAAK